MKLTNSDLLEDRLGYWPTFHDSEILSILLDRGGPSISVRILVAEKALEVLLRFDEVEDLVLQDFNHQNVLWSMALSGTAAGGMQVEFHSVFGAGCCFRCASGEVVSVGETELRCGLPASKSGYS